ncbi:MAG: hypothetical protein ACRCVT_10100 [Leadbetterella sp.]
MWQTEMTEQMNELLEQLESEMESIRTQYETITEGSEWKDLYHMIDECQNTIYEFKRLVGKEIK